MPNWEVGSEFDWSERFLGESPSTGWFPNNFELFATGTACLRAIHSAHFSSTSSQQRPKIHLPSFYCPTVAKALATDFEISWYRDVPTDRSPELASIKAAAGDVLLVLNTFGIRERGHWHHWMLQHPDVITVEDHSHDPFSAWAQTSASDYAFASLRKTLPIPDGGWLYSPKGNALPGPNDVASGAPEKRLTAMLLKNAFLRGCFADKDVYRHLELSSQVDLESEPVAAASMFTRNILPALDIDGMRQRKRANIDHFLHRALDQPSDLWSPLFQANPGSKDVPLNVIVTCTTRDVRDSLRRHLITKNIFTAIHWSLDDDNAADDSLARQLAGRVLTIPVDFRYCTNDIDRVFETMLTFGKAANAA